jgi:hypothetical protein
MVVDVQCGSDWWQMAHTQLGSTGAPVYALLEGYNYIGFAMVKAGGWLELPDGVDAGVATKRLQDVRIFSAVGEIHAWLAHARWEWRRFDAVPESEDYPIEQYLLWGNPEAAVPGSQWVMSAEERGMRVAVPGNEVHGRGAIGVKMQLTMGRDGMTGQAGIVDAALTGFCEIAVEEAGGGGAKC